MGYPREFPRGLQPLQYDTTTQRVGDSTFAKLGTFSKAMWTDRNQKLHDPTNASSPRSDVDADIINYYVNPQDLLAADRQLLNRPILKVLSFRRSYKIKWIRSIRRAHA
jgi:hypothetical protein